MQNSTGRSFDKTISKTTLNDHIRTSPTSNIPIIQDASVRASNKLIMDTKFDLAALQNNSPYNVVKDKEVNARHAYNTKHIYNHDERYESFKPARSILVRAFTRKHTKLLNTWQDFSPKVPIMAKSMDAPMKYVSDPYPFGSKVLVVAAPEFSKYNAGDILQVFPIASVAPYKGDDSFIAPEYFYVHPDTNNVANCYTPPKNIQDPEFGYFMLPESRIIGTIQQANVDVQEEGSN